MKREVKEETGMDFEPEALIAVDCGSHRWVRFTLAGELVWRDDDCTVILEINMIFLNANLARPCTNALFRTIFLNT